MDDPSQSDGNGRDPRTGRFLPGNPGGPGRPRKTDLFAAVCKHADAEGWDIGLAGYNMMRKAYELFMEQGDTAAGKMVLEYLFTKEPAEHIIQHLGMSPAVPTGDDFTAWLDRLQDAASERSN